MNPSRLLVLKPSSLGDIVHTLPAVAALRARFAKAHITWMVNPEWEPLLIGNPHVDSTLVFPRAEFRGPAGWLRFRRWRADLPTKLQPDLILDFQGLLRTALTAQAFRGTPVYGMSDAREGARLFHSKTVRIDADAHAVERYLGLAAAVGATMEGSPVFSLPAGRQPSAALPPAPWILLHPFSRGHGKSLTTESIRAFCRKAAHPVVIAGRNEASLPGLPENAVNLSNKTNLAELIWLLRSAAFVVSVDSGPMHLAAAVTDKLIGIHTWSDPCKVGPYRPGAHVWKGGEFFPALDPASSRAKSAVPDIHDAETIARWTARQFS
ncbi:MAG: glycosyltransferase family 9 protein [Chthoniobacterales bacterium]|nr:glycosyltransferase family 9 protein [Chthoniobacterales bacterium]